MITMEKPKVLPLKEAADLVDGLTVYRLRQMCIENVIRNFRFGRKYMVYTQSLLDYICNDNRGNSE